MGKCWASLVADSVVKSLPAIQEIRAGDVGEEDFLEKEMTTHSSILAWEISWTEETGGLQSMGLQTVRLDWVTKEQQQMGKVGVHSFVGEF